MTQIEINVKECVEPIINKLDYSIYDVIYEKEGKDNYLRIFIDSQNGITLNDCEVVNNAITDILDKKNFIKDAYMLEISSPGVERRIRTNEHLKQNIGNKIEIHTFKPIDKNKIFIGKLIKFDDKIIEIKIDNIEQNIDRKNISLIKTLFDWE